MLNKIFVLLLSCNLYAGVNFDGTDDRISFGDISGVDNLTEFTLAIWVYHENTSSDNYLFDKWTNAAAGGFLIFRDESGGGRTDNYKVLVSSNGLGVAINTATNSSPLQTWTHVCFTFLGNNASGLRVFIDGVEDANSPVATTGGNADDTGANAHNFYIGDPNSSSVKWFDGKLTEAAGWSKVLTAAEVALLADSKVKRMPLQIQSSSLIFYLPLDDVPDGISADGATFYDLSGNANNGTGDDGGNNTGLTGKAEEILSYP